MRRQATIFGMIALVAALGGCCEAALLPPPNWLDHSDFAASAGAPIGAELPADAPRSLRTEVPATVHQLDRKPRYLTLSEAIAIALENGTTGIGSSRNPGFAAEDLVGFGGAEPFGVDGIRVLALQPAIAGAAVEASLARFDTQLFSGINWRSTDEPTQGLSSFSVGHSANFSTGLAKPLPTGGVAGLSFLTDYDYLSQPPTGGFSVLNPSYFTRLQFGFEQPLLRDSGVLVNQIIPNIPGSSLFPSLNARSGASSGILIARLRFDSQRAELERRVNHLLLNVEVAYWNLYAAYVNLYATDQALRMATEVWRIAKEQYPEKIDESDYAGTRGQLQNYRGNRLIAIGRVLDAERNLRLLLGLTVEDGERLLPIDQPQQALVTPSWHAALYDALQRRPELALLRQDIESKRLRLIAQTNTLRPDLRLGATYTVVGLGSRLDGNGAFVGADGNAITNNSLRSLAGMHFNDWTIGLNMVAPLGFRHEHAGVRQARLELAQANLALREQENKVQNYLAKQYSRLQEAYALIDTRSLQRKAYAEQVEVRFRKFGAGKIPVDFLQESVRQWTSALSSEYDAIVEYNNALATFEFAKGTLADYDQVVVAEGPLPACARVRAVDHERKRTQQCAARMHVATKTTTDLASQDKLTSTVNVNPVHLPAAFADSVVNAPTTELNIPSRADERTVTLGLAVAPHEAAPVVESNASPPRIGLGVPSTEAALSISTLGVPQP